MKVKIIFFEKYGTGADMILKNCGIKRLSNN
jgi:hypothetical protein